MEILIFKRNVKNLKEIQLIAIKMVKYSTTLIWSKMFSYIK